MYLKFSRIRSVKAPARANFGDAGLDFFVPDVPDTHTIQAFSRANVPSGVIVEVPFGYSLVFFNKSGVAAKKGLLTGACIVDHGYNGEVHLNVINTNPHEVTLRAGEKLMQALLIPVILPVPLEVPPQELYTEIMKVGERGDGAFGSTGT